VRIISGTRKGSRIYAPKGLTTRPTSNRVREAAFNLIGPVERAAVLDLFAGSGAMGLEALSRGAVSVTFVESDREACRTIDRNLEKLGLTGARVVQRDVLRVLPTERKRYDLVLIDPPYELVESLHMPLATHLPRLLAPGGLVLYETGARQQPELPLDLRTSRRYGSVRLSVFDNERSGPSGAAAGEVLE